MQSKTDSMRFYMRDIGDIPLVTQKEEAELAARIKQGDREAWRKLITSNLRLVVKIAHDFKGLGQPLPDLISEGNIGLMRAAEKFDPEKGAKFSSYAAWWIKQAMRRSLLEKSRTIRIPVTSAGKINKIRSVRLKLNESLGREPTDHEIARDLDFSERVVKRLRLADFKTVSLEDPITQGTEGWLRDLIPDTRAESPDQVLDDSEFTRRLNHLLHTLDRRERTILLMRYGLDGRPPCTLEEVSREIGRTRERVRQIQNRALGKLRQLIAVEQRERLKNDR